MPLELLPESLHDQPGPITLKVAQYDTIQNLTDLWSSLDNELRPALTCMVTLALNPYQAITGPLVRTREIRFGQAESPALTQSLLPAAGAEVYWTIGGTLHSQPPLDLKQVRLTLLERNAAIEITPEGRFSVGNLEAGDYTLEFTSEGAAPRRFPIKVPAPDYEFDV
jgi:hypothetical protein